jgi:hypothetical protein
VGGGGFLPFALLEQAPCHALGPFEIAALLKQMSKKSFSYLLLFVCFSAKNHGYYPAAHRAKSPAPKDCHVSTDPAIAADRVHPSAVTPAQAVPHR